MIKKEDLPGRLILNRINLELYKFSEFKRDGSYVIDPYVDIKQKISNVKERKFKRIREYFPEEENIYNQLAYWFRAITRLHFYPDGNHRTALLSIKPLVEREGYFFLFRSNDWLNFVTISKELRLKREKFLVSDLPKKDECYYYFQRQMYVFLKK